MDKGAHRRPRNQMDGTELGCSRPCEEGMPERDWESHDDSCERGAPSSWQGKLMSGAEGVRRVVRGGGGLSDRGSWASSGSLSLLFWFIVLLVQVGSAGGMSVLWPDGTARASPVTAPQGKRVLMGFSGEYAPGKSLKQGDTITILSTLKNCAEQDDISFGSDAGVSMVQIDYSLRAMLDLTNVPQGDTYKICVCPTDKQEFISGKRACKDLGGVADSNYVTVQSEVTGISGNGFSGGFIYVPILQCAGPCPAAIAPAASYQRSKTGSVYQVSLIRVGNECNLRESNPVLPAKDASGAMLVDVDKGITGLEERLRYLSAGQYHLCGKLTSDGLDWFETGIVVVLQSSLASMQVNMLVSGDAYIPRVDGSSVRLCTTWDCTMFAAVGDALSLVDASGYCEEQSIVNPETGNSKASGYLPVGAGGSISQGDINAAVGSAGRLAAGKYTVCFRSQASGKFIGVGFTLTVQDQILAMEVNGVRPNAGLDVALPRAAGVLLRYIRSSPGVAGDSIALIDPMAACSALCRSSTIPVCDPKFPQQYSASGILSAHSDDSTLSSIPCVGFFTTSVSCLSSNETRVVNLQEIPAGTYKVCYRPASATSFSLDWPVWRGLGIRATIQGSMVGFNLNNMGLPSNVQHGQRLVAPRVQGQLLSYYGGAPSLDIAIATGLGACSKSRVASSVTASAGARISRDGVDSILSGQPSIPFGLYQFCMRADQQQPWASTGLSLVLQSDIESLEVNVVKPNYGVRISVPAQVGGQLRMVRSVGEQTVGDRISLMLPELDCKNPLHNAGLPTNRYSGYLHLRSLILAPSGQIHNVFNGTDVFQTMLDGSYKVCFNKIGRKTSTFDVGFTETGITVTVQSSLTFLQVNERLWGAEAVPTGPPRIFDFGNNRGVRIGLPKSDLNLAIASQPGTISFIPDLGDCADASPSGDNAPTTSDGLLLHMNTEDVTGVLPSRQFDLIMGAKGYRNIGVYQVCFMPRRGTWAATGISLTLHNLVTSLIINGVRPNAGLRITVPRIEGNSMSMVGNIRPGGNAGDKVSLISIHGDCQKPEDNPPTPGLSLPPNSNPLARMPSGYFPVGANLGIGGVDEIALQEVGVYKLCYYTFAATAFSETGITVRVQDEVVVFEVNKVRLLRGGVPKTSENVLKYCVDKDCVNAGMAGDTVSIISSDRECEDTAVQNPPTTAAGISGHMIVTDTTRILPRTRGNNPDTVIVDDSFGQKGFLPAGFYQICFRSAATGIFQSTGLSVRAQQDVIKLIVNNVAPNYGLRITVPRGITGLLISFIRFNPGAAGETLSLISLTEDCQSLSDNPPLSSTTKSGHGIKTVGTENLLTGTDVLSSMAVGSYQVCIRIGGDPLFHPSGLSLQIQSIAENVQTSSSPRGISVLLSKVAGQSFTLFGQNQSAVTKVSIILAQKECGHPDWNSIEPDLGRSGHVNVESAGIGGGVGVVFPDSLLKSAFLLTPMTFQLCVYSAVNGWESTGIAVKVAWQCQTPSVETSFGLPDGGEGQPPALFVRESSQILGAVNAVHVVMRPLATLPQGGVLSISGLTGSLSEDDPYYEVFVNTIVPMDLPLPCLGNRTCTTLLKDYIRNGEMLLGAFLSIDIACTDLDACGEQVQSVKINGIELPKGQYDKGPWPQCVAQCEVRRSLIKNQDVTTLLGPVGREVRLDVGVSDQVAFYTCNGVTVDAVVRFNLLVSRLSTNVVLGSFTQTTGEIVVPLVPFDSSPYIHITIPLRNPSVQLQPKLPNIEICPMISGGGKVVRTKAVQYPSTQQGGLLTGSSAARFTSFSLTQSSVFPDTVNRFNLVLRANLPFLMSDALAITVSGLTGTQTLDKSDFPLLADGYFESRIYDCSGARDCQVVIDVAPKQGELFRALLDIEIFCTDFEAYPNKFVDYVRLCGPAGTKCASSGTFSISPNLYSRGPWQGCSGCGRSTRKVLQSFDLKDVLAVYPSGRLTLDVGASAGVSSLPCYLTNGGVQSVKAIVRVKVEFVTDSGNWQSRAGKLVFKALPSITSCSTQKIPDGNLLCLPEIQLQFELKNPERAQAAVLPSISAEGGGLFFAPEPLVPVLGIRSALEVVFTSAAISERSKIMGVVESGAGLNKLVVAFETSAPLTEGTFVTMYGLTGTQTASQACTPVAQPSCSDTTHCIYDASDLSCRRGISLRGFKLGSSLAGSWDRGTGTLVFAVQRSFHMMSRFEFSFELLNAPARQAPISPSIRASSSTTVIPSFRMTGSILGSGELEVLNRPIVPGFLVKSMGETNKVEYQESRIDIDLMWDVPISKGSTIELASLIYTQFLSDTSGTTWYGDAKENVKLIPVAGQALEPLGQWQGPTPEFSAWVCTEGGWGGSRWCDVQQPNTLRVLLKECLRAFSPINMAMTLRNGKVVQAASNPILPTVAVVGPTMTISPTNPVLRTHASTFETDCEGKFSCAASFVQIPTCYNDTCRFLPEQAFLKSAVLTVDLSCSSFDQAGSFVEEVKICNTPDCGSIYGGLYSWNQDNNQCCSYEPIFTCQPFSCDQPVGWFDAGPWDGCGNNCSASRAVLAGYDIIPVICSGQEAGCFYPMNPVVTLAISAGADKYSCSKDPGLFVVARVTLDVLYEYKSVLSASEPSRFDVALLEESTKVTSVMNTLTLKITFRVNLVAGSTITISGLQGSQTADSSAMPITPLSCTSITFGGYFCERTAYPVVAQTGSWTQQTGIFVATVARGVDVNEVVAFSFRILNSNAPQVAKWAVVSAWNPSGAVVVPEQGLTPSVLSSDAKEVIMEASAYEDSVVMQNPNTILLVLRVNFDMNALSRITISGFTGSLTKSTQGLASMVNGMKTLADWVQNSGTISILVPEDVMANRTTRLQFTILNGWSLQDAPPIMISVPVASSLFNKVVQGAVSGSIFSGGSLPSFLAAFGMENTNVTAQPNMITVGFSVNVALNAGSKFLLQGLTGSVSPDMNDVVVSVSDAECGNVYLVPSSWKQSTGSLIVFLPVSLKTSTKYSVSFTVRNPFSSQPAPKIQIGASSAATNVVFTTLSGTLFMAQEKARFNTAVISESSGVAGASNNVSIMLGYNFDFDAETFLYITGLVSPSPSDEAITVIATVDGGAPTTSINMSGKWVHSTGSITLTNWQVLQAPGLMTLRFLLQNPSTSQASQTASLSISRLSRSGKIEPEVDQTAALGSVLTAQALGSISAVSVTENSKVASSSNRIICTFSLNFALSYGARVTVTGLTGTSLSTTTSMLVSGANASLFGNTGSWDGAGRIIVQVSAERVVPPGTPVSFAFILTNRATKQSGVTPSLEMAELAAFPRLSGAGEILSASDVSYFLSASISEDSMVLLAINVMTVRAKVSIDLLAGAQVTISGLEGALPEGFQVKPGSPAQVDVPVSGTQVVSGIWVTETESVVLTLSQDVAPGEELVAGFELLNPPERQNAVSVSIAASGRDATGASFAIAASQMDGKILSSSVFPAFVLTDIAESSLIAGGKNTLTVTLEANTILYSNENITIQGLKGSRTASSTSLAVSSASNFLGPTADWNQETGTLKLLVATKIPDWQQFSFSFTLLNPFPGQTPVVPEISTRVVPVTSVLSKNLVWNDGVKRWRGAQPPAESNGQVLSGSDTNRWFKAEVRELSRVADLPNKVFLDLVPNSRLDVGATITVSGLVGTQEPDTSSMIIGQLPDGTIGTWVNSLGQVSFSLPIPVEAGGRLLFSLPVQNPSKEQPPVTPRIALQMTGAIGNILIPEQDLDTIHGCCLSSGDSPRFLTANARERTNVPGQLNEIHVELLANVILTQKTLITLSGLTGTPTPNTLGMKVSDNPALVAPWNQDAGTVTVAVAESMYFCDCIDACDRNSIVFSIQLRNPLVKQSAPQLQVSASNSYINIGSTQVSGKVLSSSGLALATSTVFEATNVTSLDNIITIEMMSTIELGICKPTWLTGISSWITSTECKTASECKQSDVLSCFPGRGCQPTGLKQIVDNLISSSVDVVLGHNMNIQFDLGQDYSLSQFAILGVDTFSSVRRCKLQYALSATASETEWKDAGGVIEVAVSNVQFTYSAVFEFAVTAEHWRLVIIDNWDGYDRLFYTSVSEVKLFACPDVQTTTILVNGLNGSTTPSNNRMPIFGRSSRTSQGVRDTAIWEKELGSLSIKMLKSVPTFDIVRFQFELRNADSPQPPMQPVIKVIGAGLNVPESKAFGTILSSDEVRLFSVRSISESSTLQGDLNVLNILLQPNVPMTVGQELRIRLDNEYFPTAIPDLDGDNFICPDVATSVDLPCVSGGVVGTTGVAFRYRSATNEGEWTDGFPSVIVRLNLNFPLGSSFSFSLQVQNPAGELPGLTPIAMGSTLNPLPMSGVVMSAPDTPTLFAAEIGESSTIADAINTLTITMTPSVSLPAGSIVTISGLTGTVKPPFLSETSPGCVVVNSDYASSTPAELFQFPFSWKLQGCLELGNVAAAKSGGFARVTLAAPWPASQPAVLSWKVKNANSLQSRKSIVQIAANQAITVPRTVCKSLIPWELGVCYEDADVLNVDRVAGLLWATARESTKVQGQENLITVSLLPNIELATGTLITVSGLVGTQTADSSPGDRVPLRDGFGDAFSMSLVSWTQSSGEFIIRATASLNRADKPWVSFQIALINGAATQSPPVVTIRVAPDASTKGTCGVPVCDLMGLVSYQTVTSAAITEVVPLALPSEGILSNAEIASLIDATATETSMVLNQDNLVTLSFGANFFIRSGTIVTFTGLTGSQTSDNPSIRVFVTKQANEPGCDVGVWQKTPGTLTVALCQDLPAAEPVSIKLVLRNPADKQAAAVIPLTSLVMGAIRIINSPMNGGLLQAADSQRIIGVEASQMTTVVGQPNTIFITFSASVPLATGANVTIGHIAGFDLGITCGVSAQSFSLPPLAVRVKEENESVEQTQMTIARSATGSSSGGACVATTSSFSFLLPRSYAQNARILVSVTLPNAPVPTPGGVPSVAVTGCRAALIIPSGQDRQDLFCSHATYTELRGSGAGACSALQQITGTGAGVGGDPPACSTVCTRCQGLADETILIAAATSPAAQLLFQGGGQPALTASISEETSVISQPNVMTVIFKSNIVVPRLTTITLSGLAGSQTPSNPMLPLGGSTASLFLGSGNWKQSGVLVLTLDENLDVQQRVDVSFTLINKNRQDEAECRNGGLYCTKQGGGALREGLPCSIEGRACPGQCVSGKQFCFGGDPTLSSGDCSSISMLIPENVPKANRLCTGSLCTLPNTGYQCPLGALVSVRNASSAQTHVVDPSTTQDVYFVDFAGRTRAVTSNDCNGGGTCDRPGVCTPPNTYKKCTAHSECTGFTGGDQRCMRVDSPLKTFISMSGGDIDFSPQILEGSVLGLSTPYQPEFVVRIISESSTTPGSENVLTVTLTSNFPLQDVAKTFVTLAGIASHTPSSSKLPLYSASQVVESSIDCDISNSGITCHNIGANLVPLDGVIISASLTVFVDCGEPESPASACGCSSTVSGECAGMITRVTTPCGSLDQGFSPLPCYDRVECASDGFCKAIEGMNVVSYLVENPSCNISAGQGFDFALSPGKGFAGARANLTVRYSLEYLSWQRPADVRDPGTIVLNGSTAPSMKIDSYNMVFSFQLLNRPFPAAPEEIFVTAESGGVQRIGICEDRIDVGCTKADEPSRARAILVGTVLSSSGKEYFDQGLVFESSQIAGGDNTITVYLKSYNVLPPESIITITGLRGSTTAKSSSLPVLGSYTSNFGEWGTLTSNVPCCDTLLVRVVPRPISSGPLIISFVVTNPVTPQEPQVAAALATGGSISIGGFDTPLICATYLVCTGVISGATIPTITAAAAFEKNRFISQPNIISLSVRANAPLHSRGSSITVSGLRPGAFVQGPVPLVSSEAIKQILGVCTGVGVCVFSVDSSVPDGATILRREMVMTVQCAELQILTSVTMCGILWGARPLPYNCSDASNSFYISGEFPPECPMLGSTIVEISGNGALSISAKIDIGFSLGSPSGGAAKWTGSLLVVNVAQNLTEGSVTLTDGAAFAFSVSILNSDVEVAPVLPTLTGSSGGTSLGGITASRAIMGAKLSPCRVGSLLEAAVPTRFPAGRVNSGNFDQCAVIVQPASRKPGDLISVKVISYELDETAEMISVYNGDSPAATLAAFLLQGNRPLGDPRWYSPNVQVWSDACALTFHLTSKRKATVEAPLYTGFATSSGGFALQYGVQDPKKLDFIEFTVKIEGLSIPLSDVNQQIKFRKALGSTIGVMFAGVIMRDITRRRGDSAMSSHGTRRAISSQSTTKVLSAGDASQLADQTNTAFQGGAVTSAMSTFGMQGRATLVGKVRVFRCGFELNCDGSVAPPPPPPQNATVIAVVPDKPFPVIEVVTIGGILFGVPIAAGFLLMIMGYFLRRKMLKRKEEERVAAIEEYHRWVDEKVEELEKMDEDDRDSEFKTYNVQFKEEEWRNYTALLCAIIWSQMPNKGLKPKGIWRNQAVKDATYMLLINPAPSSDAQESNKDADPNKKWGDTHEEVAV